MLGDSPWGFDGASTEASEAQNASSSLANADPSATPKVSPTAAPTVPRDTAPVVPSGAVQATSQEATSAGPPSNTPVLGPSTDRFATSPAIPNVAPDAVPATTKAADTTLTTSPITTATPLVVPPTTAPQLRRKSQGKVVDRVKSLNDLQSLAKASATRPHPDAAASHHPVSPETARRVQLFVRRDVEVKPLRPLLAPGYTSTAHVHSPFPTRIQPQLSSDMEKGATINTTGRPSSGMIEATKSVVVSQVTSAGDKNNDDPKLLSRASRENDQVVCPRHGRKLASRQKTYFTTTEGLERSLSGAYVPVGRKIRSQVDALNPWALMARHMTKAEGTTVSPEICPDCLAEHEILSREISETLTAAESVTSPSHDEMDHVEREPSSTHTEAGTPTVGLHPHNVLIGTVDDHQTASLPGSAVSGIGIPPDEVGSIVAADLGDMLDAIIIEHSGILDRVITNLRDGMPGSAKLQQLSQDLTKVSEAVGAVSEDQLQHITTITRDARSLEKRSIILDASVDGLRKRTKSIPQLLSLIDATAEHFGLNVTAEKPVSASQTQGYGGNTTSTTQCEDKHKLPALEVPGGFPLDASPGPSTLNSPLPSPAILIDAPISGLVSPPKDPTTEAPGTPSPSKELQNKGLVQSGDASLEAASANAPCQPSATVNDATASTLEQAQPPPRPLALTPTTGRAREIASPLHPARLAPFQTGGGANKRTLVKPSEVAKHQRQQRTFEQEWLRSASASKTLANTERSGRRGKIGGEDKVKDGGSAGDAMVKEADAQLGT
ncbi:hypothetical protein MBLNU459_g3495t1 [Dothideomycetes sp. NU459]